MIKEKYLPLGSVVLLKEAKKRLMITGFCVKPEEGEIVYDYIGCLYPEGVLSSKENPVFNHDQIERVFCYGCIDEEQKEFMNKLNELLK